MKKYILISVVERDIYTETFNTYEEAQTQMINELLETIGYDTMEELEDSNYVRTEDYDYSKYGAWLNGNHGENYDWKIIEA